MRLLFLHSELGAVGNMGTKYPSICISLFTLMMLNVFKVLNPLNEEHDNWGGSFYKVYMPKVNFKEFVYSLRGWDISIPAKDNSEQLYEDANECSV